MGRDLTQYPIDSEVNQRIAYLWNQAEEAVQSGDLVRARRHLRWILTVCPEDEEAWLWQARLIEDRRERLACLQQAYRNCPDSRRVQAALRQARTQQLETSVGELRPKAGVLHFLPDERRIAPDPAPVVYGDEEDEPPSPPSKPSQRDDGNALARAADNAPAWLAFLLPLAVYVLTACSTVYTLDSAEFSAAVHVLGIVRATGYPLYLLLGKLFTWLLPVGDTAFRLNIMSAVCAAGTSLLLYFLVRRLTRSRPVALAASLFYAFSYYFWAQAVIAEVYALHTLLTVALLLLILQWERQRTDWLLAALGLLLGLSFGNHVSVVLMLPALAVFMWLVARGEILRPRALVFLIVPFIAGLAVYLYIPLRYLAQPAFNYAGSYNAAGQFVPLDMTQPANLWWLVSGKGFQSLMFDYSPVEVVGEIWQALYRLWGNFLGLGLVLGLVGIWAQRRRNAQHLWLFGLLFLANMIFFVNYRVVDKETMFGVAYLVWAVWIGEGLAWLIQWVQARLLPAGSRSPARQRAPFWAWGFLLLALVALMVNGPLVNIRTDTRARDRADLALTQARSGAIIFGWWTSAPPMHYLQLVEGRRPDVLVINRFLIGAEEMYALIDDSLGARPVYTMELDEGLVNVYRTVPTGFMFELAPRETAEKGP